MKSGYRTDIDGLRAIAVLAVVLFHINPALVPGGFAGVDIFFVISGFLLTSIIHREKTSGTFSYANFYIRRIRRIVPALFVVVCVTLLAGQFILLPQHLVELSKSAIASMLGAANVFFTYFVDTGYFAEDSATKPLLHIWSLGVEEQFYLIWPAAALFLVTSRRPLTIAIAATLCLVLLSEWLVRIDTNFAYYMLPARAFELMIGASLAFVSYRPGNARTANVIGLAGLALIAVSLIFIDESWTFPGINALPSTLGAALVILSGSAGATLVSRALSIKPMRDIGKISYSLYLWHWPIVAFLHYAFAGISPAHGVIAFVAMIALSVASYRYVEEPCRNVQISKAAILSLQLVLPMILICGASVWLIAGQGARMITQEQKMRIASLEQASKAAYAYNYICQGTPLTSEMIADKRCIINGNAGKEPDILLWGDSHAAHHVGILGSIAEKVGFAFRNAQNAACPPLLTEPERYASPGYSER